MRLERNGKIEILGPSVRVWDKSGNEVKFRSRSCARLLALLAVSLKASVPKSRIAATLWPESDGDRRAQNLRRVVADVRAALEPSPIRVTSTDISLCEGFDVDLQALRDFAKNPSFAQVDILERYRGSAFSESTDAWEMAIHREIEDLFAQALDSLAGRVQSNGNGKTLASLLRHAVSVSPKRADLRVQLIRAQARLGQPLEAFKSFEELSDMLDEEFGEPIPEAAHLALNAPPDHFPDLAAQDQYFETIALGRKTETHQIAQRILNNDDGWINLVGPAGIGKSTVAKAVEHTLNSKLKTHFVPLATITRAEDFWSLLATTLYPGTFVAEPEASLRDLAFGEPRLVILDNAEHLLPEITPLIESLATWPGIHVLITSREPLSRSGEEIIEIGPLEAPDPSKPLEVAIHAAAPRLFLARLKELRPDFAPTFEDYRAILQTCLLLEGHPQSIVWASAYSGELLPAEIANLVEMESFDSEWNLDAERLFARSFARCTPTEQDLMLACSIFAGAFDLREAQALVPTAGTADLASLIRLGLLGQEPDGRYRISFLIRWYCRSKTSPVDEEAHRLAAFAGYRARSEELRLRSMGMEYAAAKDEFTRIEHNLLAIAEPWVGRPDFGDLIGRTIVNVYTLAYGSVKRQKWVALARFAGERSADPVSRAYGLYACAYMEMIFGDIYESRSLFDRAVLAGSVLSGSVDYCALRTAAYTSRTIRGSDVADLAPEVIRELRRLLTEIDADPNMPEDVWTRESMQIAVRNCVASSLRVLGRHQEAIEELRAALPIAERLDYLRFIGLLNLGLAHNAWDLGDLETYQEAAQKSWEAFRLLGERGWIIAAIETAALADVANGQLDIRAYLDELEANRPGFGATDYLHSFLVLGFAMAKLGRIEEARSILQRSFSLGHVVTAGMRKHLHPSVIPTGPPSPRDGPIETRLAYRKARAKYEAALAERMSSGESGRIPKVVRDSA